MLSVLIWSVLVLGDAVGAAQECALVADRVVLEVNGSQTLQTVAADGRGRSLVVWHAAAPQAPLVGERTLWGQWVGADGAILSDPVNEPMLLHDGRLARPHLPAVAVDLEGRAVVAWQENETFADDTWRVLARQLDSDGTPGAAVAVAEAAGSSQVNATVAMLDSGGFVVAWSALADDGWHHVHWRLFDDEGGARNEPQRLSGRLGRAIRPDLAATDDGFVLVSRSLGPSVALASVDVLVARADGGVVAAANGVALSGAAGVAKVGAAPDGRFAVAWSSAGYVLARRFAADGEPIAVQEMITAIRPNASFVRAVEMDERARAQVVWSAVTTSGRSVEARRLHFDGALDGPITLAGENRDLEDALDVAYRGRGLFSIAGWSRSDGSAPRRTWLETLRCADNCRPRELLVSFGDTPGLVRTEPPVVAATRFDRLLRGAPGGVQGVAWDSVAELVYVLSGGALYVVDRDFIATVLGPVLDAATGQPLAPAQLQSLAVAPDVATARGFRAGWLYLPGPSSDGCTPTCLWEVDPLTAVATEWGAVALSAVRGASFDPLDGRLAVLDGTTQLGWVGDRSGYRSDARSIDFGAVVELEEARSMSVGALAHSCDGRLWSFDREAGELIELDPWSQRPWPVHLSPLPPGMVDAMSGCAPFADWVRPGDWSARR